VSHSAKNVDSLLAATERWWATGGTHRVRHWGVRPRFASRTVGHRTEVRTPLVVHCGSVATQKRLTPVAVFLSIAILWTSVAPLGSAAARAADSTALLVVVHPSNPVGKLSDYEIARIFRGETLQWPDGRRVQVIDYTEDRPERRAFYHSVYHSGPRRQRPRGSPYVFHPLEQSQPDMVRRLVGLMPNAVAYLPAEVDTSGLKIVARIDRAE